PDVLQHGCLLRLEVDPIPNSEWDTQQPWSNHPEQLHCFPLPYGRQFRLLFASATLYDCYPGRQGKSQKGSRKNRESQTARSPSAGSMKTNRPGQQRIGIFPSPRKEEVVELRVAAVPYHGPAPSRWRPADRARPCHRFLERGFLRGFGQ